MRKLLFLLSLVLLTNVEAKNKSAKYEKHELKYYEEFLNFVENYDMEGKIVNFYFYGEKNDTVRSEKWEAKVWKSKFSVFSWQFLKDIKL